jgi:fructosamine-3-kinase
MEPTENNIPEEANSWLESQIGNYEILCAHRIGSARTGVWHVQSGKGKYFFKINRRRSRWGTEVFAYKNWTSAIEPYVPTLVAVFDDGNNPGILLSEMFGIPLSETGFNEFAVRNAYYKAGMLLRRLHESMSGDWFGCVDDKGLPIDWSGNPLSLEMQHDLPGQKLDVLTKILKSSDSFNCFDQSERQILQWAIESVECYASEKPIPTSEDYTPGNWLVDNNGELTAIIDFENMLWGDRMFPFARLLNDYFPHYPNGEKAFYDGYGSCPPDEQPDQAKIACAIYAGHYVTLGHKEKNEGYIERGRVAFKRVNW